MTPRLPHRGLPRLLRPSRYLDPWVRQPSSSKSAASVVRHVPTFNASIVPVAACTVGGLFPADCMINSAPISVKSASAPSIFDFMLILSLMRISLTVLWVTVFVDRTSPEADLRTQAIARSHTQKFAIWRSCSRIYESRRIRFNAPQRVYQPISRRIAVGSLN